MDETHNAYTDDLLARLRRYEFFGFKGGCDMLLRLEKTKEFLNAQNHSIARAEAWACVADMKDLVIPIGKTLFDAAAKIESLRAEVAVFVDAADELERLRADLIAEQGYRAAAEEIAKRRGEMVDALIAERDALAADVATLKAQDPLAEMWRELSEYQEQADRDRDKALERWMDQVTAMLCHSMTHSHDAKQELVNRCDAAIDAMRKGATDGK